MLLLNEKKAVPTPLHKVQPNPIPYRKDRKFQKDKRGLGTTKLINGYEQGLHSDSKCCLYQVPPSRERTD